MKWTPWFGCLGVLFVWEAACGQTVQLPSFQHLDASTTVWVPDGGSVNTGGITRSSSGENYSGTPILPFGNRSFGSSSSTSMIQTSVQVIDLQEMDAQILNAPSAVRPRRPGESLRPQDQFQIRQAASVMGSTAGAFLSARDAVQARIRLQKSPSDAEKESGVRADLRQSLDLRSRGGQTLPEEEVVSDLNSDLNLSAPVTEKAGQKKGRKQAKSPKKALKAEAREPQAALQLARKGEAAEKNGKKTLAFSYYEQALELAEEPLRGKIEKKMKRMKEDAAEQEEK